MAKSCREVCPIFQLNTAHTREVQATLETVTQRYLTVLDELTSAENQVEDDERQAAIQELKKSMQELGLHISQTGDLSDKLMDQDDDSKIIIENCSGVRIEESDKLVVSCGGFTLGALIELTQSLRELQGNSLPVKE